MSYFEMDQANSFSDIFPSAVVSAFLNSRVSSSVTSAVGKITEFSRVGRCLELTFPASFFNINGVGMIENNLT